MTVTYSLNVANAKLTGFSKLLLRWKGSIYKLLYREMLIFCGLYYILSMSYRHVLDEKQKIIFEKCVIYCRAFTNLIPLSFVLGFYVSIVVTRWWQQFMQIPWPDKAVLLISGYVRGDDERGRIIRRTLARYLVLMQVLTFQAVSTSVRRRFPTLDHIQEVGLFTAEERFAYDEIIGTHGKWWVPAQWFTSLVTRARRAGRIKHDYLMDKIIEELHAYRSNCGMMFAYDWISIPLVYTQTVTIATYTYFIATIMGRQYLDPKEGQPQNQSHDVDLYFPIFTILEFFFFMGWLKVAEQLINPYGEDDDDFELNWCLDRNLLISYIIVDEMYNKHPKLVPDMYWDKREPILPYTKSSINMKLQAQPHLGSTVNLAVEPEDFLPMETIMEEEREDFNYSSPPGTSTVDYNNSMPSLFRNPNSTFVQMENQQSNLNSNLFNKNNYNNISKNHSELIEELKAESNSSRTNSRNSIRFLPYFLKDSKLIHKLFYSSNSSSINIPNSNNNLPNVNNYSQGNFSFHQNKRQTNESTFLLKTPAKRNRKPSNEDPVNKSLYQNQPLLTNNTSFSMNTSTNASNSNLASLNNNFNNSLSSSKINTSNSNLNDILSNTNLNIPQNFAVNNNLSTNSNHLANSNKIKPALNKKFSSKESDDLTSNPTNQLSIKSKNYKNLKISKTNLNSPRKYCNLPTAPVLSSTSNNNKLNKMSPFMNNLRNSFNFSSYQYRNLNKLSSKKKQNSFSSALSLKLNNDSSSDQLVTSNGFHFPKSYEPKNNLNQYLSTNLKSNLDISKSSIKNEETTKIKTNEEDNVEEKNLIEIKISPASNCSYKDLNSSQSLLENYEENLIVMDDLKKFEDKKDDENSKLLDISLSRNNSTYSLTKAASILKATTESKNKSLFQNESKNENSVNFNKFTENSSNKSLDISTDENKLTKNDQLETLSNQSSVLDSQKPYSPNEDCAEEHYEESSTSSNSSISPYESNQSTVTSYTQLLEKDKEYFN